MVAVISGGSTNRSDTSTGSSNTGSKLLTKLPYKSPYDFYIITRQIII